MKRSSLLMVGVLIVAGLQLAACAQTPQATASDTASEDTNEPAYIEPIAGTELHRVVLTEQAFQRLGIQTAPIREEQVNGTQRKVIPYAAVIYDLHGETWTYTRPEPLTFVRQAITVERIDGDRAILVDGPPAGTEVATVGVAELYGTEYEVGH